MEIHPPESADQKALVGVLERITYHNEENGFLIGRLSASQPRHLFTIKGLLPNVREGETLKVWGDWEEHPDYGEQFRVDSFLIMDPANEAGIERYLLASFKGIGPVLAHRIVKLFGKQTFEILDNSPENLLEVSKFPAKLLPEIKQSWQSLRGRREVLVFLHSIGISQIFGERIYEQYGLDAVSAVKDNPYRLAREVRGIGFRIADRIAARLGFATDSPRRVEAGVLYCLDESAGEGHTGLPESLLQVKAAQLLEVRQSLVAEAVARVRTDGLIKALEYEPPSQDTAQPPEPWEPLLLQPRLYRAEGAIAESLERIQHHAAAGEATFSAELISTLERESGLYLAPEQHLAVESALKNKVLIITGGPGTGKTTIVRFILNLVRSQKSRLALAAPTGKAAKRLNEATGHSASTIHRLLEAGKVGFERNKERPLETDLVIIDESSMIDTLLMEALLKALPDAARLILVGDVDQLPSVGAGMVLADLIESGRLPVVRLETVFRQLEHSRITANAHCVRRGEMPDLSRPAGDSLTDFYFIEEPDPAKAVDLIRTMVTERIPERFGLDPLADIQVLCPMHRGLTGAQNLNVVLQQAMNPKGAEVPHGELPFRVGDRVMQTRNDYDKEVFNGDMGEISAYDPESGELSVTVDGAMIAYERKAMDNLMLAYAITVHKAQGSEYPAIVLPISMQHRIMLVRNLLYTALTRGRRLVVIVGAAKAVQLAVRNDRPVVRHTGLRMHLGLPPRARYVPSQPFQPLPQSNARERALAAVANLKTPEPGV